MRSAGAQDRCSIQSEAQQETTGELVSNSPNQTAALALAKLGLHVFPCNSSKKPTIEAWEQNATANSLQIEAKWQSNPHLLPAIPTSAHSIVVIDCDVKDGKNGIAEFRTLCAAHSIDLSTAFVVETPSKGLHFYFRSEQTFVGEVEKVAPGVDVRSHGNYVIAPGATLPDGSSYKLVHGSWNAVPALPAALAAFLRPKVPAYTQDDHISSKARSGHNLISSGLS
jgi:hypothetical protein